MRKLDETSTIFVKLYEILCLPENVESMRTSLKALCKLLRNQPGCLGTEAMSDTADGARFVFMERWESEDACRSAARRLGQDAFAGVLQLASVSPASSSLHVLR